MALAWAYYWGKSLPAAVNEFDYVEQGGQELRAAGFKWSFQEQEGLLAQACDKG